MDRRVDEQPKRRYMVLWAKELSNANVARVTEASPRTCERRLTVPIQRLNTRFGPAFHA